MSNKIFLKYDKLKWLTSHQTHGNNFTDYIAFWKIKQYSETNRKGRYFGFSWCKFRCLEMSLCLTVIKVKDNMQINNFYWGSVEQQCLVSLYKLFWGKKTPFFFWQSIMFACLFRQTKCWNIYVGYLHWSVLFWNVSLVQNICSRVTRLNKLWRYGSVLSFGLPPKKTTK